MAQIIKEYRSLEQYQQTVHFNPDALKPDQISNYYRFPVKLKLDSPYLASKDYKVPLKPGMAISANLKLRDKRLISILSDLLVDQSDSVRNIKQQ